MARRSASSDLADALHELFLHVPAWLCLPAAAVAYLAVQAGLAVAAPFNPVFRALAPSGPLFGGMAAALVLAAGLTAAIKKARRRALHDRQRSLASIRALSWVEFEQLVGEAYRRQGYRVTETGGGGADGGIDLILQRDGEKWLAQCKQWRILRVGVRPVRELFGVMTAHGAAGAILISSGDFTQEARDFAAGKALRLVDGDALSRLVVAEPETPGVPLPAATVRAVAPDGSEAPECPVCQQHMVRRTARRGANTGAQFWGCPAYPRCRGTRQIQP